MPPRPPEPSTAVAEYLQALSAEIIARGDGISPADIRTAVREIGGNASRSIVRVSPSHPDTPTRGSSSMSFISHSIYALQGWLERLVELPAQNSASPIAQVLVECRLKKSLLQVQVFVE